MKTLNETEVKHSAKVDTLSTYQTGKPLPPHTPGELTIDFGPCIGLCIDIRDDEKKLVAAIGGCYDPQAQANAKRLAVCWNSHDALLSAAKAALPFLRNHVCMTLGQGPADRITLDRLEAAISKAEGSAEQ